MLWIIAFLFKELNAFVTSTNNRASVSSLQMISPKACIAASHPDSCPAHNCKEPTFLRISGLIVFIMTAFPIIRRITYPTPIGRTPGFLFRGISLEAVYASRSFPLLFESIFLCITFWETVQKHLEDHSRSIRNSVIGY